MALSLAGAAALASASVGQPPNGHPMAMPRHTTVSPWPGKPRVPVPPTAIPAPPPVVHPSGRDDSGNASPFAAPAVGAAGQPHKTLYYRKDSNAPLKPAPAAEVALPIAAQEVPLPRFSPTSLQPQPGEEKLPPPRSDASVAEQGRESLIPPPEKLFRLDSESRYIVRENERRQRLREDPTLSEDTKKELGDVEFPDHPQLTTAVYTPRMFGSQEVLVEPNYVCYRKLLYEDRNTERYGWTVGPLQPLLSSWKFWGDLNWAWYKWASTPCLRHECSAGLCLPGDPVPMMRYPPGLSLSGALVQAGVTVAMYIIIP